MKKLTLIYLAIIFFIPSVMSATTRDTVPAGERADTLIADTVRPKIYSPPKSHGTISKFTKADYEIGKRDILYENYIDFSDILYRKTSAYPHSLGSFGQNNTAGFFGGKYRDLAVSFNGRQISEPEYGGFLLSQFPVEFFEKAEIYTGSDATIIADNASGAAINFQEIFYNTAKPYTRLWYSQAGFEFLAADGVFSQNIAPNLNVTAGFRSMASLGEYENDRLESWNGRIRLRYALDSLRSISLTENYTNHKTGLSGGINPDSEYLFSSFYAEPVFRDMYENTFRHDLTLSYSSISQDSGAYFRSNVYFTNVLRRKYGGDFYFSDDSVNRYDYRCNLIGADAAYERNIGIIDLTVGGKVDYNDMPGTYRVDRYSGVSGAGYGRVGINLTEKISVSGGARLAHVFEKTGINAGAKIKYDDLKNEFRIDVSTSTRFPTPAEGLKLFAERHILATAGYDRKNSRFNFSPELFFRRTESPITASPEYDGKGNFKSLKIENSDYARTVAGLNFSGNFNIHEKVFAEYKTGFYYSDYSDSLTMLMPKVYAELRAWYTIRKVRSDLRIGLEAAFLSPFEGEVYSPLRRMYYFSGGEKSDYGIELSAFAAARFSGVHVRLTVENIFDYGYYYLPYYPQPGRNIRLGLSFPFVK